MRYFLRLSYNGAPYHGWQRQPNATSVQEELENALGTILRRQTPVTGAGRTDTGVNARVMYAHFDAELSEERAAGLPRALNSLLGRDIAVHEVIHVDDGAHARFDAVSRSYRYFVCMHNSAFANRFCWRSPSRLDFDLMNEAAQTLLQVDDFTSFAKLHSDAKTNICDVTEAKWKPVAGYGNLEEFMVFEITADRFLRNMVRSVVGTLVDVGRHKISLERFAEIIESKNRCAASVSMPAHALFLWDVKYPYL